MGKTGLRLISSQASCGVKEAPACLYYGRQALLICKMKRNKAQSLLELAIFGVILLTLLGTLLTYGLRSSFQQQMMQRTFRKALGEAGPGSASYVYIKDRHIPDPTSNFAQGSVMPFSYSDSVTRDWELFKTADTACELPKLAVEVSGSTCPAGLRCSAAGSSPPCYFLAAGFGNVCLTGCPNEKLQKYKVIFGSSNVWKVENSTYCAAGQTHIRFIDSCEGEIIAYEGCQRQCRMMTDVDFCTTECQRAKIDEGGSSLRCQRFCAESIPSPWYCDAALLDNLFSFAANKPYKTMGIQPDYRQDYRINNVERKRERPQDIRVTDNFNWSNTTTRIFIFKPYGGTDGTYRSSQVDATVQQNKQRTMNAPW